MLGISHDIVLIGLVSTKDFAMQCIVMIVSKITIGTVITVLGSIQGTFFIEML